jgi:hypothetical protein
VQGYTYSQVQRVRIVTEVIDQIRYAYAFPDSGIRRQGHSEAFQRIRAGFTNHDRPLRATFQFTTLQGRNQAGTG